MQKRTLQRLGLAAATALAVGLSGGVAHAAPTAESDSNGTQAICGYWRLTSGGATSALYTHCDNRTRVVIRVENSVGPDFDVCVGPGTTVLGTFPPTYFAWYRGILC